ncbi:MAG: hypothetical protein GF307_11275 [candidate division Zixibacteria bacterium]|nr:hypothetical protein [candidate division Zixibacteria bacterium]
MSDIRIYIGFFGRLLVFYLRGCRINPSRVFHIQQVFYHQIKSLLDKRIFPYLYKIEMGDTTYENNLVGSVIELHGKFLREMDNILQSLPPTLKLLRTLLAENNLSRKASNREIREIRQLLPRFREQTRMVFVEECRQYSFDLADLLVAITKETKHDYKELIDRQKIKIDLDISKRKPNIYIAFNETSTWREILRNFIINAIEACEDRNENNLISIRYGTSKDLVNGTQIKISDTGCGMSQEVLSNFYRREYTSGKKSGTGFGVIEEYIEFLNRRGEYSVESTIGKGTTITIQADPRKIGEVGKTALLYRQRNRIIRIGVLLILLVILFLASGGIKLIFPPTPEWSNYIAGFTPGHIADENRPNEYESIKIRTETNEIYEIDFKPRAIKIAFADSVGPICYDIDQDSRDEMVATILPPKDERALNAATIECYNARGEFDWSYSIEYDGRLQSIGYSTPERDAELSQMYVMDFKNDGKLEIICLANFANGISQLYILSGKGKLIQKYIHFGPAQIYEFANHRQSKPRDPVLAGINMMLDNKPVLAKVEIVEGEYQGAPYPLDGVNAAKEIYYILDSPEKSGLSDISIERFADTSRFYNCFVIGKDENLYVFQLNDGRILVTTHSLEMVSIDYDSRLFEMWWNKLIDEEIIPCRSYNNSDLSALGRVYQWKDSIELFNTYSDSDSLKKVFRGCTRF